MSRKNVPNETKSGQKQNNLNEITYHIGTIEKHRILINKNDTEIMINRIILFYEWYHFIIAVIPCYLRRCRSFLKHKNDTETKQKQNNLDDILAAENSAAKFINLTNFTTSQKSETVKILYSVGKGCSDYRRPFISNLLKLRHKLNYSK